MFKDMKLGTKIAGGFALVLVMTVMLSLIGYNGLHSTITRVVNADDVNRIVKYMKDIRIQEKNYMMRGDEEYIANLNEIAGQAQDQENGYG